jgi:hypothetical protein
MPALGPADVAQTRSRKGLAADAPDRNRTSARGLGSRSIEASGVRLGPLCPFGTGTRLHRGHLSNRVFEGYGSVVVDGL